MKHTAEEIGISKRKKLYIYEIRIYLGFPQNNFLHSRIGMFVIILLMPGFSETTKSEFVCVQNKTLKISN